MQGVSLRASATLLLQFVCRVAQFVQRNLDEYIPIGECPLRTLSGVENLDAIFVFTYLLTSYDDRAYAVGAFLGNFYPQYAWMWREAESGFSALVQRYGEQAVLGAAKRVRAARKNSDGITITDSNGIKHWPYWWISTLAGDEEERKQRGDTALMQVLD